MSVNMLRDVGVVLRTVKLGEADRIVSILTRDHGKIKGVAKGARKSGSKYSARLESGSVVDFQWISSTKDLVRITQTEAVQSHRHIREDLDLLNCAARMLDAVDSLCEDKSAYPELTMLTIRALATMDKQKSVNVCPTFLMKVLALEGFAPEVEECPSCGTSKDLNHFSLNNSSFFCSNCARESMIATFPHTRETIKAIQDGKTSSVIENMATDIAHEIETIAVSMVEYHTGRRLRAVVV